MDWWKKCHNYCNNTLTFCSSKVQPKPQWRRGEKDRTKKLDFLEFFLETWYAYFWQAFLILCIKFHNIKNINANDHKTLTQVLVNHNIPMIFLTKIMKMYVSSIFVFKGDRVFKQSKYIMYQWSPNHLQNWSYLNCGNPNLNCLMWIT